MLQDGLRKSAIKDEAHAAVFFQKACDGKFYAGCIHLGDAYLEGRGVPKDEKQGVKILSNACQEGFDVACDHLAEKYVDGRAGKVDIFQAIELFDKACLGMPSACTRAKELRSQHQAIP